MTTERVEIGIGIPVAIPDGRPPAVAVGFVGGEARGVRVELGAAIKVPGGGRDVTGGDTGLKPGMLIGKHFLSRSWLTVYLQYVSGEGF